ncbi:MAG: NfeD family protein [Actinomycetota bacterium]
MFGLFPQSQETKQLFPEPLDGIADEAIAQGLPGRAFFQASYWPARLYDAKSQVILSPGQPLKVVGMDSITLLVIPAS